MVTSVSWEPDALTALVRFREGVSVQLGMDEILWHHHGKLVDNREHKRHPKLKRPHSTRRERAAASVPKPMPHAPAA